MNLIEHPKELEFIYDLKIENEINKSVKIFEKMVSDFIIYLRLKEKSIHLNSPT